jgi:DNA repair protein RadD
VFTLRPYQVEAVNKLLWSQQFSEPDLVCIAQGGGKSLVIAEMAHRLRQPVLILQPSQEIARQNIAKMRHYVADSEIGVYSASLSRKDFGFFTFATIGSIYKKPELFSHFKQVIIDEADLVPVKNMGSMFMSFLAGIGHPKVIGLTGSPYRMAQRYERLASGELLTHTTTKMITRVYPAFWRRIIYNISTRELINLGFLVPFKYVDKTIITHDQIKTNISRSDFNLSDYEEKIKDKKEQVLEAIFLGMELGRHVLCFCSSVDQAEKFSSIVPGSAVVTAKTPKKEREKIVVDFRSGKIPIVFNVQVLTVGFDFPELDCIICLRPSRSIRLWGQMIGRGSRICPGKKYCWVIDMVDNTKNLGKVETIRIEKVDGKWEIISDAGSFHNKPLFSYKIKEAVEK